MSSIFFNGRLISIPGSYSEVDASGLDSVGLSAVGIVAVIGDGEGGIPVDSITETADFIRITKPQQARDTFRSGALREVADMLFNPSVDPDIQGGAVEMVAMKTNPATQSTVTLSNAYGSILDLTSVDYGAFTTQINLTVGAGTNQGKLITVTFEDTVETGDDIGGNIMFNLKYTDSGEGWDTMTSEVETAGDIVCNGTRDEVGLDGEMGTQIAVPGLIRVVSAAAGDTTQQVVVYGLDGSAAAQTETINLDGTSTNDGLLTFSAVYGVRVVGTTAGIVTVSDTVVPTTIMTIAAGANLFKGIVPCEAMYVSGSAVTVVGSGATTKIGVLVGKSTTGAVLMEKFTLNGTTPVVGTALFSELDYVAAADIEVAVTITYSAEAARSDGAVQDTLQKAGDYFNARYDATAVGGFVFTMVTGTTTLDPANLDITTGAGGAVTCLDPANPAYYADTYAIIAWFTSSSQFVSAALASGGIGGAPTNTTSAVYLTGGIDGVTTNTQYQTALNLLKQVRVNTIVLMSHTPAVHAMLQAHCAYMAGVGRSERDGFVGLQNTGLTDVPTKTEAKAQVVDLNTRHIRAFGQTIDRYNTAGTRATWQPMYQAAIAAGMQAGSPVGTSLTFKYANVLALNQDTTWNPTDDAEEMINAGLCFMEEIDGVGRRVVRNVTTYLIDDNLSYTEGSVNEAVNFAVFNLRTEMESAVGASGFAGTVNAAKSVAIGILGLLGDANIITTYRSLALELIVDVLELEVEIAPVIPINFVKNTIHLVTIPQTAA